MVKDGTDYFLVPQLMHRIEEVVETLMKSRVDDAVADFYLEPRDEILTTIVEDAIIADDYDKLSRIFGLDESIEGLEMGSSGRVYEADEINEFPGEELGLVPGFEDIIYLDDFDRILYEVDLIDGQLYKGGDLLSDNADSKLIFVLSSEGKIYCGSQRIGRFHHSSFLSGANVVTAGEFNFLGDIIEINAKSGHYTPDISTLTNIVEELILRGMDIRNIKISRSF